MNQKSLKKLLELLVEVKVSNHNIANTSAGNSLDEAIALLEEVIESKELDNSKSHLLLSLIGKFLDKLPSIATIIKTLSG